MSRFDPKSVAILGRNQNTIALNYDKSIVITTDILKFNSGSNPPEITLDDIKDRIGVLAKEIILSGNGSTRTPESMVYGESLVELLRWIIDILVTHKHPPNAAPIPTFFDDAATRSRNLEVDLLNKRIKTR